MDVSYFSALGSDPFSAELRGALAAEGVNTTMILTDPSRQPGLYVIRNAADGERSFHYWRNDSAARQMFSLPGIDIVVANAEDSDLLCYSLITLAILPESARKQLWALCERVRARGGRVAFDGNFRSGLWLEVADARDARDTALSCCDIGLPTLIDEQMLSGTASAEEVAHCWHSRGVDEVVVKLGSAGCFVAGLGVVPPPQETTVVDSSGAGDAFNAGYLYARSAGNTTYAAALAGHALAGWVIGQRGAIPKRTDRAPYQ